MERDNKDMKDRREKGKADYDRLKAQSEAQNKRNKEFEDALNEMSRKSNLNERELTELKRQFEAERRKSMSV
jgi:DNA gyrase/topoisomerase IV subunit A